MRHVVATLVGLLLVGCVQLTDTSPLGTVASIAGRWTIDFDDTETPEQQAENPTSRACTLLGASRVRVTFLDELRPVTHPGLFFQCRTNRPSGEGRGFDTRDASGAVLAAGCWSSRLSALDSGGAVIAVGPTYDFVVPAEGVDTTGCVGDVEATHVDLPIADFLSAKIIAATELAGGRAGEASCRDASVVDIRLVFDDLGGGRADSLGEVGVTSVTQPCAFGRIAARVRPGFEYVAHIERVDSAGTVTAGAPQTFSVTATGAACFFNGSCRSPCRSDEDCQNAAESCRDSFCRVANEPATPTVDLDGL